MNVSADLGYVDLTTAARVIERMDADSASDSRMAFIESMIQEVGSLMMLYLGRHLLRTERTEVYELRRFSKTIRLDGVDVTEDPVIKTAATPSNLAAATALIAGTDFYCEPRGGVVRLFSDQPNDPLYVEVTYTGGYFNKASDIGTKHLWLTDACEQQVVYRLQRQDTMGGNVTALGGGGTQFEGAYNWLPQVRQMLNMRRRGAI